jgi:four helix bundle protein
MYHLRCYQLAVQFYRQARGISLPGPLKNQLQRAASSIALNLSEGTGRRTRRDRQRFFHIALGSIRECQAIIDLERSHFSATQRDLLDHLAASTYKLTRVPDS